MAENTSVSTYKYVSIRNQKYRATDFLIGLNYIIGSRLCQ